MIRSIEPDAGGASNGVSTQVLPNKAMHLTVRCAARR